jgi:ABC-type multidrug transport system ATPase subunit
MGPAGSGKSTLMHLLAGLDSPNLAAGGSAGVVLGIVFAWVIIRALRSEGLIFSVRGRR